MRRVVSAIALAFIAPRGLAQATRTLTHDQDGRLTKAAPRSGLAICYAGDQVDNRTTATAAFACVDEFRRGTALLFFAATALTSYRSAMCGGGLSGLSNDRIQVGEVTR